MARLFALSLAAALAACAATRTPAPRSAPAAPAAAVSVEAEPEREPSRISSAESSTVLAVLPMKNNTGDSRFDGAGYTLSEIMAAELARGGSVTLVERQRIAEVLGELGLARSTAVDPLTTVKIGKLLGAQLMAFGSIAKLDSLILLTARVVNVETGAIVGMVSRRGGGIAELERMAREAGREAAAFLGGAAPRSVEGGWHTELDLSSITPAKGTADSVAVVIGARDYRSRDIPRAEYAINDARAVRHYLTRLLGFREENVIFAENPTKAQLETLFGTETDHKGRLYRSLTGKPAGRTDVFVYFSGHGAPALANRQAYLVLADSDPNYVALNGYSRNLLLENLGKLGARRVTVILEACFSGNSDRGMLIRNASPLVVSAAAAAVPPGVDVLASSAGDQISSWYPEKSHSAFTFFLLKALKNGAPAPPPSLGALFKEVGREVEIYAARAHNRVQTPQLTGDDLRPLYAR